MTPEPLITPDELARRLNVSRVWVYRLANDGRLPSIRVGDKILRFDPGEIRSWLEEHRSRKYYRDGLPESQRS